MSADVKGLKRVCVECGVRFYDMKKRPIICPSCATEFTGQPKVKPRKAAVKEVAPKVVAVIEEEEELDAPDDTVELNLDDAAALEAGNDDDEDENAVKIDLDDDISDLDEVEVDVDEDATDDKDED